MTKKKLNLTLIRLHLLSIINFSFIPEDDPEAASRVPNDYLPENDLEAALRVSNEYLLVIQRQTLKYQ